MKSLSVFIQQSDGEKVVNHGKVKYDSTGKPVGIEIEITKFSTFTIIHMSGSKDDEANTHSPYIQGYGDEFRPEAFVKRSQMAAIAYRWVKQECAKDKNACGSCSSLTSIKNSGFTNISSKHWASEAISFMKASSIMSGYQNNTFKPEDKLTRAQAVKVLNRLFKRGPLSGIETTTFKDVSLSHWAFKEIEEAAREHQYEFGSNEEELYVEK